MSLRMQMAKYGGSMPITLAGPPAGTTTWGGAGFERFQGPMAFQRGAMAGDAMYGDPGLFSFLGKAIRGGLGVVSKLGIPIVSGAAGIAGGLLGGGARIGPGFAAPVLRGLPPGTRFAPPGPFPLQTMAQIPTPGIAGAVQRAVPGGATGMQGCPAGFRPNKSGYTLKSGQYIAPNTVCVKSRRMNPLNPRALSRSMRRIESAKRAASVLGRITIRKVC